MQPNISGKILQMATKPPTSYKWDVQKNQLYELVGFRCPTVEVVRDSRNGVATMAAPTAAPDRNVSSVLLFVVTNALGFS